MSFEPQAWKKLSEKSYPRLHEFLDPNDLARGEQELEKIRTKLLRLFQIYHCTDPEVLTVETIDRVAVWCEGVTGPCDGEPFRLFRGFARHVFQESVKEPHKTRSLPLSLPAPEPNLDDEKQKELMSRCLGQCMSALSDLNQELILSYYHGEKRAKIEHREELAERLNVGLNALRIRVCRLRAGLRKCVLECVAKSATG